MRLVGGLFHAQVLGALHQPLGGLVFLLLALRQIVIVVAHAVVVVIVRGFELVARSVQFHSLRNVIEFKVVVVKVVRQGVVTFTFRNYCAVAQILRRIGQIA